MVNLEIAVNCIMRAIDAKAPLARFPTALAGLMGVVRIVPRGIFERLIAIALRRSAAPTDSVADRGT
jgi:hypothetical protein